MMKKIIILSVLVLLAAIPVFSQALDSTDLDITIGNVRVPKVFIHAGKEYNKGNYWVTITDKEGVPYFNVFNQKKELLFEELAIQIPTNSVEPVAKTWHRVSKKLLSDYEYFRIKLSRPDGLLIAFLLIKPTAAAPAEKATPAAEPKTAAEVEMH